MYTRMSFDTPEQRDIIYTYQMILERIAGATRGLAMDMNEICERTHYEPFVELAKMYLRFYQETVKAGVRRQYDQWSNGDTSLRAYVLHMDGGEDAARTAEMLQNQLRDAIEYEMFPRIDPPNSNTSFFDVVASDFDVLNSMLDKYVREVQRIRFESIGVVERKLVDNSVFTCIKEPTVLAADFVSGSFDDLPRKIDELKRDWRNNQRVFDSDTEHGSVQTGIDSKTKGEATLVENFGIFDVLKKSRRR